MKLAVRRRALPLAVALAFALPAAAGPGKKKLELEDLVADPPLAGRPLSGLAWVPGSERLSFLQKTGTGSEATTDLYLEDARTGKRERLVEGKALVVPQEGGSPQTVPLAGYLWSPDGKALLLSGQADLWLYRLDAKALERLTKSEDEEEFPSFSPDGARIAYVSKNNLHVLDLAARRETPLTSDGTEHVYNGRLDWVYEEELANRWGRSYEWSPDGKAIAYIRLDENRVPAYPLVDFLAIPHAAHQPQRYPNPGDPNSIPSLHVVSLEGKEVAKVGFGADDDVYVVPRLAWTRDSRKLAYQVMNRAQTELRVSLLDLATGASEPLVEEKDPYWLNVDVPASPPGLEWPHFLADGRFLWPSERTGYLHLYLGRMGEKTLRSVTQGEWMIDGVAGIDEARGLVYFTSTQGDARQRQIWRVKLDGSGLQRLTSETGTHGGRLSPAGGFIVGSFSSLSAASVTRLVRADGGPVRLVDAPAGRLGEFDLAVPELVDVKAADGTTLHGLLVKPSDFDPKRRYPVVVRIYGGPLAQTVTDEFRTDPPALKNRLFDHYLAERGTLVWRLDNRGSFGRGHAFETPIFKDMGRRELEDQLAGVAYLKSLPYVDASRIGIYGWSYGGYMTLYALANSDVFRCGIAGAPPVDWRLYDTIYTERYMRTPKENPDGYRTSAPLTNAGKIKARLLVIHGTGDDNVHMQNTLVFLDALIKAGVPYELLIQPGQKHGFNGKAAEDFLNRAMAAFLERSL